jgi:hypothetical protein
MPTIHMLKYAATILSTCLGVLGLLSIFRDTRTGKITFSGRMLLVGIILSGIIVVAIQASEEAQNAAERNELLEQVSRGQYPLRDVRLSCWTDIPTAHAGFTHFRERFVPAADGARAAIIGGAKQVAGISGWGWKNDEPIDHVSVCPGSPLYPDALTEPLAYSAVHRLEVVLNFYKSPIPVSAYPFHDVLRRRRSSASVPADLTMTFRNDPQRPGLLCMEYDFARNALGLFGMELETNPKYWGGSGRIISLADLRGAQVFIEITPTPVSPDEAVAPKEYVVPGVREMIVDIGELHGIAISTAELAKHVGDDGLPFYEYRFANTTDAILQLSSRR